MSGLDHPDNRRRFATHAAIEAIKAELDQAYAAEQAAQKRIKFLTELLIQRAAGLRERTPLQTLAPEPEEDEVDDA